MEIRLHILDAPIYEFETDKLLNWSFFFVFICMTATSARFLDNPPFFLPFIPFKDILLSRLYYKCMYLKKRESWPWISTRSRARTHTKGLKLKCWENMEYNNLIAASICYWPFSFSICLYCQHTKRSYNNLEIISQREIGRLLSTSFQIVCNYPSYR